MKPHDLTASRFFVGPTQRPIAGPAEDHFEFIPPDYPQATAEEFAAAATSLVPFHCEVDGRYFRGTCILTSDDRIVAVIDSSGRAVARLKPDAATRLRASMATDATDARPDLADWDERTARRYRAEVPREHDSPRAREHWGINDAALAKVDAEQLSDYKARWCGRYLGDNCYCARDRAPGSDWCQPCSVVLGSQA